MQPKTINGFSRRPWTSFSSNLVAARPSNATQAPASTERVKARRRAADLVLVKVRREGRRLVDGDDRDVDGGRGHLPSALASGRATTRRRRPSGRHKQKDGEGNECIAQRSPKWAGWWRVRAGGRAGSVSCF